LSRDNFWCDLGIRPLIKHRIFAPYDHAYNARIDDNRYNQRLVTETVNSAVKCSLGSSCERHRGCVNSAKSR
jgi:hypothetical protein